LKAVLNSPISKNIGLVENIQSASSGPVVAADRKYRTGSLNILVADSDHGMLDFYKPLLLSLGHEVRVARSGPHLVAEAREHHPDLVITEIQLPGMDGVAAADEVCRQRPAAIVLVSRSYEPLSVARALTNDCIIACLSKPLDTSALWAALAIAVRRFEQMEALRAAAAEAGKALEDRKLIERAKGAVMQFLGVDEEEAFRRLRKSASNANRKLCEISREILGAAQMFRDLETVAGKKDDAYGAHNAGAPRPPKVAGLNHD